MLAITQRGDLAVDGRQHGLRVPGVTEQLAATLQVGPDARHRRGKPEAPLQVRVPQGHLSGLALDALDLLGQQPHLAAKLVRLVRERLGGRRALGSYLHRPFPGHLPARCPCDPTRSSAAYFTK